MLGEPNTFAYLALIAWPVISVAMFAAFRPQLAVAITLIGGAMFLPERVAFDLPGFPAVGKQLIASGSALVGGVLYAGHSFRSARVGRGGEKFVVVLAAASLATAAGNLDPLIIGPTRLPPMSLYDGISLAVQDVLQLGLPFFLGRVFFRTPRDLQLLIIVVAVAGLVYSLPILYEIRMAPVLHRQIYGFHQHSFLQTLRFGGYRPMVFMAHGLALAVFVLVGGLAAIGFSRVSRRLLFLPARAAALYLTVILVACKSLGALVYGAVLLPLLALARPAVLMRIALVLSVLVMVYPALRVTRVFPIDAMLGAAERIDPRRAHSLRGRFANEEELLARARDRFWFGWGAFGRARIYDRQTGRDETVSDGYWIIQMGNRGIVGFVCAFGLLLHPAFAASRRFAQMRPLRDRVLLATLTIVVVIHTVDLLPNGFLSSHAIFLAGALGGVSAGIARDQRVARRSVGAPSVPPIDLEDEEAAPGSDGMRA